MNIRASLARVAIVVVVLSVLLFARQVAIFAGDERRRVNLPIEVKETPTLYFEQLRLTVSGRETAAPQVTDAATLQCIQHQKSRGWAPRRRTRPLYILALGTEGTGHHALQSLLRGIPDREYRYTPDLHLQLGKQYTTTSKEALLGRILQGALGDGVGSRQEGPVIFDSQHSCPFGPHHRHSAVTRCPDVMHLLQLHREGRLDLKVVLLHRNPVDAVMSTFRRGFAKGDFGQQLRTIEFSLSHLEHLFRALPCLQKFYLPYPLLERKASDLPIRLAHFLGLGGDAEPKITMNMLSEKWEPRQSQSGDSIASSNYDALDICQSESLTGPPCGKLLRDTVHAHFQPRLPMWPVLSTLVGQAQAGSFE